MLHQALDAPIEMCHEDAGLRDLAELLSPNESRALTGIEWLSEEIALPYDDDDEARPQDVTQAPQRRRHLRNAVPGLSAVHDGSIRTEPLAETGGKRRVVGPRPSQT